MPKVRHRGAFVGIRGGAEGAYGQMCVPIEIRLLGGRSFMGTKKTTFMITNDRPEGRPHAPPHVSKSTYVLFATESEARARSES